ncbi:trehalose-phosphatase [Cupriavidus sp. UGS-1]|uniref:trehalose-phosphatase n=1 Tax=Cupriavidus sp. UGS-1 TaxID=2899826 RepID=UPI001E37821D|nr:trehalose-phosphatase [Cupriavidus sp. UGS-1]MCD9123731.1 trehalose-phosphatase [Cupriavidus sp. UGS-1]
MSSLPLIDPDNALFLDFDGTLADLAPRPELVQVEAGLVGTLRTLHRQLGGAVAIVSGRTIAELDAFLAPLQLPTAGVHGAELRDAEGRRLEVPAPDLDRLHRRLEDFAQAHPGLRLERKPMALAVHYRAAPELETLVREQVAQALGDVSGLEMLHGKMVVEVKPAGVTKGSAVELIMRSPPFAGRMPIFAGDDVTDEDGFAMVAHLGGVGVLVGQRQSAATVSVPAPADLRAWLHRSARALDGSPAGPAPAAHAGESPGDSATDMATDTAADTTSDTAPGTTPGTTPVPAAAAGPSGTGASPSASTTSS